MKSQVVLMPCDRYDMDLVYQRLRQALCLLFSDGQDALDLGKLIHPEEKVLLKLNLVRDAPPERAVTTHPAVVEALARILREEGYDNVCAGDSPGFGTGKKIMQNTGMAAALEKYGFRLAAFEQSVTTDFPEGIHAKRFELAKDVREADAVISVCKMKTHALEHLTGAVKNQYGCIQGKNKAIGHTQYPSAESMARMLIDLNRLVKPRLFIMDGIVAMEGNGPTSGDPVPMNVLLLSRDPVALDTVFAALVNLDPTYVPTNVAGDQMGLGTCHLSEIEVITPEGKLTCAEAYAKYGNPSYRMIRERGRTEGIMGMVTKLKIFAPRPHIDEGKCKRCGICVESCPVEGKAVNFTNGRQNPPTYNYKRCIRCFCCQEMCPHKAIEVR